MKTKVLIVLTGLLCISSVHAQRLDSLQKITLDEIVVSAQRQSTIEKKITQQVHLIPQSKIEISNAPTTADLLTETGAAGVQKSQQGGGSPSIRGFEASRILLYVDNVPMNNLIYRAGHLQNMVTIDPSMLASLEVLYGPASVTYGSDALGGVVHFYTKNPKVNQKFELNGMLRTASANFEKTGHVDFTIGLDKWAFLTSISFSDFGDLKSGKNKNPFLPDEDSYIHRNQYVERINDKDSIFTNPNSALQIGSGYKQIDLMQKILFQPSTHYSHLFNVQFSTSTNIPRYDRLTEITNHKPSYAEWYYGPQQRLLLSYNFNGYEFLGADKTGFTFAYQNTAESRHSRKLNKLSLKNQIEDVNAITFSSFWSKNTDNQSFTAGLDGALNYLSSTAYNLDINTQNETPTTTRYPDGKDYMHHLDGYFHYSNEVTDKLLFTAGARLGYSTLFAEFRDKTFFPFAADAIKQNNFTYSGSVGVNYRPDESWKLALGISSGYRVPNIDDLSKVFDSQAGILIVPNPAIKPEKTVGVDITIEKDIDDVLRWANHLYSIYLFDGISVGDATFQGKDSIIYEGVMSKVKAAQNYNKGYVYGFSSSLNAKLGRNFAADASINYQYGQIALPESMPLDHIAPLFGRVGVNYLSANKKIFAEFFSLFNGKKSLARYNLNGEDNLNYATLLGENGKGTPAWYTLNARCTYKFTPNLSLQIGINNILDTEYRTFASGINAPGRNIYSTFRFSL